VELDRNDVLITTGGSEALMLVCHCILDPYTEIIVPEPYYPNYSTFVVDASVSAKESQLAGYYDGTVGKVLTLKKVGVEKSGVNGIFFDGSTGAYSFGDGKFYISKHGYDEQKGGQFTTVTLYELNNSKDVWEFIEK
jgi:hypothetical protein